MTAGVSSQQHAPAALYTGKDPVPILQEAGWAPEPVWTGGKSRPHRDRIQDRPVHSQSLYRLSYRAHSDWFRKKRKSRQTVDIIVSAKFKLSNL